MSRTRLLTACAFFGAALYLAICCATLDARPAGASASPIANLGGSLGAALARGLIQPFGAGAFGLPFFLVFLGWTVLSGAKVREPMIKILGVALFMTALGVAIETVFPNRSYPRGIAPLGGLLGELSAEQLHRLFGSLGASLVAVLLLLASVVLATDRLVFSAATRAWEALRPAKAKKRRGDAKAGAPKPARAKKAALLATTAPEAAEDEDATGQPAPALAAAAAPAGDEDDEAPAAESIAPVACAVTNLDRDDDGEEEMEMQMEAGAEADVDAPLPPIRAPEPVIRHSIPRAQRFEKLDLLPLPGSRHGGYELPPPVLLAEPTYPDTVEQEGAIREKAKILEQSLKSFGITARVVEIQRGPVITMYELELQAGTKVKQITNLGDDLAMALRATTVRVVAPLPGKSTVGVEVPNAIRETVYLLELLRSQALGAKKFEIPLLLGKDAAGGPLIEDLANMPHVLIAGSTGSGKSVCLNSVIMSILLTRMPEDVKLILVDPKMVELQQFKDIPHLLTPVVTDMKKAPKILDWAVMQMEERYELLAAAQVRNITGFNRLEPDQVRARLKESLADAEVEKAPTHLPYIVIVVDELADLMMMSAKDVEISICRLAQKSRAVGIHIILATQRPSVDVITGLIKSNMPARLSFKVASKIDSRTILDRVGADRLLGHGDMLFLSPRSSNLIRAQGTLVADSEIKSVTDYLKEAAGPPAPIELLQVGSGEGAEEDDLEPVERDELYDQAVEFVLSTQRGSVSMLQRKLGVGYTRAARLIDLMAEDGIVGDYKGSKAREVVMTLDQWRQSRAAQS